jgi:hypothetical protein
MLALFFKMAPEMHPLVGISSVNLSRMDQLRPSHALSSIMRKALAAVGSSFSCFSQVDKRLLHPPQGKDCERDEKDLPQLFL